MSECSAAATDASSSMSNNTWAGVAQIDQQDGLSMEAPPHMYRTITEVRPGEYMPRAYLSRRLKANKVC